MNPVYHYKVTFSAFVDAGDTYQAILKAMDIVKYYPNCVCTDVWNRGLVANIETDLPKHHMSTYYTGYEDCDNE